MARSGKLALFLPSCAGLILVLAASGAQAQVQSGSEAVVSPLDDLREVQPVTPDLPALDDTKEVPPEMQNLDFGGRVGPNYVIGPEDVLILDIFNVPELSKTTVRVANDGTISLPLLGPVKAAGLTPEQLRGVLEEKWGEMYLQNPQVTIFIQEFKAKPVSVIGAVEKPGLYPLTGHRTLIETLSMAGGLGRKGSSPAGRFVLITRKTGFGELKPVEGMRVVAPDQVEIDIQRLLYSRDEGLNIEIQPLDIISVTKADIVYVVGAVRRPGGFVLEDRPNVTVLQALAMAEGLTGNASKGSARIIRLTKDGTRIEVRVNLGRLMKGKAKDSLLAANDILFVPESTPKAAGRRTLDAIISTLTGIAVFRR